MKRIGFLFCVAALGLAMPAMAQRPQICGLNSGSELASFADSVAEVHAHESQVVAAGLEDLYSFPDLQNLLAAYPGSRFCVSSLVAAKNIYQYDSFLITVVVTEPSGHRRFLPLVFQTASVQAHHNIGPKPWFGFKRVEMQAHLRESLKGASFQELPRRSLEGFSPTEALDLLFTTKPDRTVESNSTSYVYIPDIDPDWTTFLVSHLTLLHAANPYTSTAIPEVGIVQVQEANGRVRIAPLNDFFTLYREFTDLQEQAAPAVLNDGRARLSRLESLTE